MASAQFPFFDLTRQYQGLKDEILDVVHRTFDKQAFVMGDEVTKLESELAVYLGVKHVVTCSSGTDALVLALKALNIGSGDEVLTTPFSFFASTSSILLTGARPVFVDINGRNYNIDPGLLERALTPKTKAILPVHLFGQAADMDSILSFARQHGLPVIEDAAQSIGAKYKGKSCGALGQIGALSFYPTKNLGGAGEGGAVTTNDDKTAEKVRLLRVHGMKVRYTHDILGWNSRLDSLQAAVLRVKLPHLNKWVERRQKLAGRYGELLSPLAEKKKIVLPLTEKDRHHVWNQFVVLVENRNKVRQDLEDLGVPTDIFYPKTIPAQPVLQELGYSDSNNPVARDFASRALALPIFPELTDAEQAEVVKGLQKTLL